MTLCQVASNMGSSGRTQDEVTNHNSKIVKSLTKITMCNRLVIFSYLNIYFPNDLESQVPIKILG